MLYEDSDHSGKETRGKTKTEHILIEMMHWGAGNHRSLTLKLKIFSEEGKDQELLSFIKFNLVLQTMNGGSSREIQDC